jgi:hypothetical protein
MQLPASPASTEVAKEAGTRSANASLPMPALALAPVPNSSVGSVLHSCIQQHAMFELQAEGPYLGGWESAKLSAQRYQKVNFMTKTSVGMIMMTFLHVAIRQRFICRLHLSITTQFILTIKTMHFQNIAAAQVAPNLPKSTIELCSYLISLIFNIRIADLPTGQIPPSG